jgi:leucine dehydrogenase
MSVYDANDFAGHEQVSFFHDQETGLKAIIAIHNLNRGPALGGCRMYPYATEADALRDVLRLSKGMTYKAASMNVDLGGGKSVIIGDAHTQKTPELLHAMGRCIEKMGGRYITGEDIGTNPDDMAQIRTRTKYVSCLHEKDGGYGDPAPMTALGVYEAMRAGCEKAFGTDDLKGMRVAVQGAGNVSRNLFRLLDDAGAEVITCDTHKPALDQAVELFGVATVEPEAIYDVEAEIFSPCAIGATINDDTLPRLKAKVVAGAANNQLDRDEHGRMLGERGILYLPDYVANGGGLICVAAEWYRHDQSQVVENVRGINRTCKEVLARAEADGVPTAIAADRIAEERYLET